MILSGWAKSKSHHLCIFQTPYEIAGVKYQFPVSSMWTTVLLYTFRPLPQAFDHFNIHGAHFAHPSEDSKQTFPLSSLPQCTKSPSWNWLLQFSHRPYHLTVIIIFSLYFIVYLSPTRIWVSAGTHLSVLSSLTYLEHTAQWLAGDTQQIFAEWKTPFIIRTTFYKLDS